MNLVLVYQTIANENWINKFNVKRFLYNVKVDVTNDLYFGKNTHL